MKFGLDFTKKVPAKKPQPTPKPWTRLCVSDGLTESDAKWMKTAIPIDLLRGGRKAIGLLSTKVMSEG